MRRRHRTYWAAAALAAVVGAIILIVLEGGAASQTSSPAAPAQMNAAAQAGTPTLAFTSNAGDTQDGTSELYVENVDGSEKRLLARRVNPNFFSAPALVARRADDRRRRPFHQRRRQRAAERCARVGT